MTKITKDSYVLNLLSLQFFFSYKKSYKQNCESPLSCVPFSNSTALTPKTIIMITVISYL